MLLIATAMPITANAAGTHEFSEEGDYAHYDHVYTADPNSADKVTVKLGVGYLQRELADYNVSSFLSKSLAQANYTSEATDENDIQKNVTFFDSLFRKTPDRVEENTFGLATKILEAGTGNGMEQTELTVNVGDKFWIGTSVLVDPASTGAKGLAAPTTLYFNYNNSAFDVGAAKANPGLGADTVGMGVAVPYYDSTKKYYTGTEGFTFSAKSVEPTEGFNGNVYVIGCTLSTTDAEPKQHIPQYNWLGAVPLTAKAKGTYKICFYYGNTAATNSAAIKYATSDNGENVQGETVTEAMLTTNYVTIKVKGVDPAVSINTPTLPIDDPSETDAEHTITIALENASWANDVPETMNESTAQEYFELTKTSGNSVPAIKGATIDKTANTATLTLGQNTDVNQFTVGIKKGLLNKSGDAIGNTLASEGKITSVAAPTASFNFTTGVLTTDGAFYKVGTDGDWKAVTTSVTLQDAEMTALKAMDAGATGITVIGADDDKTSPIAPAEIKIAKGATPALAIDYAAEQLYLPGDSDAKEDIPATIEYSTNNGTSWTDFAGAKFDLTVPANGDDATTMLVRTKESTTAFASANQTITISARPAAPTNAPDTTSADGKAAQTAGHTKLGGTVTGLQYSYGSSAPAAPKTAGTAVPSNGVIENAKNDGTKNLYLKVAATDEAFASAWTDAITPAGNNYGTVTASAAAQQKDIILTMEGGDSWEGTLPNANTFTVTAQGSTTWTGTVDAAVAGDATGTVKLTVSADLVDGSYEITVPDDAVEGANVNSNGKVALTIVSDGYLLSLDDTDTAHTTGYGVDAYLPFNVTAEADRTLTLTAPAGKKIVGVTSSSNHVKITQDETTGDWKVTTDPQGSQENQVAVTINLTTKTIVKVSQTSTSAGGGTAYDGGNKVDTSKLTLATDLSDGGAGTATVTLADDTYFVFLDNTSGEAVTKANAGTYNKISIDPDNITVGSETDDVEIVYTGTFTVDKADLSAVTISDVSLTGKTAADIAKAIEGATVTLNNGADSGKFSEIFPNADLASVIEAAAVTANKIKNDPVELTVADDSPLAAPTLTTLKVGDVISVDLPSGYTFVSLAGTGYTDNGDGTVTVTSGAANQDLTITYTEDDDTSDPKTEKTLVITGLSTIGAAEADFTKFATGDTLTVPVTGTNMNTWASDAVKANYDNISSASNANVKVEFKNKPSGGGSVGYGVSFDTKGYGEASTTYTETNEEGYIDALPTVTKVVKGATFKG